MTEHTSQERYELGVKYSSEALQERKEKKEKSVCDVCMGHVSLNMTLFGACLYSL